MAEADPAASRVGRPLTIHLGPEEVLLNLDIKFQDDLATEEIGEAVNRIERAIRDKHPEIKRIYVEVNFLAAARESKAAANPPHGAG